MRVIIQQREKERDKLLGARRAERLRDTAACLEGRCESI